MPEDRLDAELRGALVRLAINRVLEGPDEGRFDAEIVLSPDLIGISPRTMIRLADIRDVRLGDPQDGLPLGVVLSLGIVDVAAQGWDGVRFKLVNLEQGCALSLFCRSYEIVKA